jgi:hypothetical protein
MKKLIGSIAASVLLAGCANAPTVVASHDNFLMMAGFTPLPSGSPMAAANANRLPKHMFAHHTVDGVTTYYYFDPTVCGCLYTGTAEDWAAYKRLVADRLHMQAEQFLEQADTPMDTGGG